MFVWHVVSVKIGHDVAQNVQFAGTEKAYFSVSTYHSVIVLSYSVFTIATFQLKKTKCLLCQKVVDMSSLGMLQLGEQGMT